MIFCELTGESCVNRVRRPSEMPLRSPWSGEGALMDSKTHSPHNLSTLINVMQWDTREIPHTCVYQEFQLICEMKQMNMMSIHHRPLTHFLIKPHRKPPNTMYATHTRTYLKRSIIQPCRICEALIQGLITVWAKRGIENAGRVKGGSF